SGRLRQWPGELFRLVKPNVSRAQRDAHDWRSELFHQPIWEYEYYHPFRRARYQGHAPGLDYWRNPLLVRSEVCESRRRRRSADLGYERQWERERQFANIH